MLNAHLCLNVFALLVGTCHIAVILVYFFGCVKDGSKNYISNILSNDKLYMNLMTFFVLLQLTVCFGFVRMHALTSSVTPFTPLAVQPRFFNDKTTLPGSPSDGG